jgi:hypothetical protein
MKIIVTTRSRDYHACVEGQPGLWAATGSSPNAAIGELITAYAQRFGIEIQLPEHYLPPDPPQAFPDLVNSQECTELIIALAGVDQNRLSFTGDHGGSLKKEVAGLLRTEQLARALVGRIQKEHRRHDSTVVEGDVTPLQVSKRHMGKVIDGLIEARRSGTDVWTDVEAELNRLGFEIRPKNTPSNPLNERDFKTINLTRVEEDILLHMLGQGGRGYIGPSASRDHLEDLGFIQPKDTVGWIFASPAVIDRAATIRKLREEEDQRPSGYFETIKLTAEQEEVLLGVLYNGTVKLGVSCKVRDLLETMGFLVPYGPIWRFSCEGALRRAIKIQTNQDKIQSRINQDKQETS